MNAIRRFIEGYKRGAKPQREIEASKPKSTAVPTSTTMSEDSFGPWDTVSTFISQLDYEADRLAIHGQRLEEYLGAGVIRNDEWKAIETQLSQEREHQEYLERKRKIQEAIRGELISRFIQEHVPTKYDYQKESFRERIEQFLWEGKAEDLNAYLMDVLQLGLERANEKERRKYRKGGYLGYTWQVVTGVFQVGIVLGVFSVAKTRFETIVFALIILTYQTIRSHFQGLGTALLGSVTVFREESMTIRRLLKERTPETIAERENEEGRELEKATHRTQISTLIQTVFSLIVWAIALFELVVEGIL
jgi:hypothetical protein